MSRIFLLLQLLIGMVLQLYFNWLVPEAIILLWILLVHAVGGRPISAVTLSALVGMILDSVYGRTVPINAIALPMAVAAGNAVLPMASGNFRFAAFCLPGAVAGLTLGLGTEFSAIISGQIPLDAAAKLSQPLLPALLSAIGLPLTLLLREFLAARLALPRCFKAQNRLSAFSEEEI